MHIPLKVTTDYTLLKSLIKMSDLISFLCDNKINACGICDENLYGVLDFYFSCKKNNIKPIIGLSIKLNNLEVCLYAINYEGYKNLLKIHTLKEKNELNVLNIKEFCKNILVILPYESKELYNEFSCFDVIFIGYKTQYEKINALAITKNIVFFKDLKVLKKEEVSYLKYLDILRKDNIEVNSDCCYCDDVSDENIEKIVNLINIEIPLDERYIPKYSDNSYELLKNLCVKGLNKRLNGKVSKEYVDRLKYELDVINKMGFVDYFLIVYDYVLYAKKNNILVGPGRGSAAGSLVSYSIGITEIDPISFGLMFERFLNPERITMPDIDIDFDAYKREQVIDYVRSKYGMSNVALGLTFTTFKSKLVLREVGKILNISNNLLDSFIKCINGSLSLKDNLKNEIVKKYINNYKEIKNLYVISMHLEGLKKNTSTHAAGVVISSEKLDEIIPIHCENNTLITGCTMDYMESIGLLKMDFLAVKNLSTIANILDVVGHDKLKNISLDNKEVYKIFSSGKTEGIFQFETPLLRNIIKKIEPTCFQDLVAGIALGRPGAIDEVDTYVLRKNGKEKVDCIDKSLDGILKETYGIIIYQEQIMAILRVVAGYTLAEADLIRRAISKKKENIINEEKEKFINKSLKRGYKLDVVLKIYDLIVKFANYGFNKSHSVAYAYIAYQMAYLKLKYPEYFIIEMINGKDSDKLRDSISYLKSKGFRIVKPDINLSKNAFYVRNKDVIMPFTQVKGINEEFAKKIIEVRDTGFKDIFDFAYKSKDFINIDIFKILVKAGVFDSFMINRHTLMENVESIINYANLSDGTDIIKKPVLIEVNEYDEVDLRNDELEAYGMLISNHPSSKYKNVVKLCEIEKNLFKNVKCVVLVDRIRSIKTKKNEDMAFMLCSDETKSGDFTVFPNKYEIINNIYEGDLVEIMGSVSKRFDKVSIIVNNIKKVV
ncbi:MAG: DNA polymerase III subunit alpha [Firmicutes bacterium]|nr:DNA polymerase III subunit alpha [Bacillota bacterium]